MKRALRAIAIACVTLAIVLIGAGRASAAGGGGLHYYVALGDSLAASFQPNGVLDQGYAEQLYAALKAGDSTLRLVKLGCGGESTYSFRFGSVRLDRGLGFSCGSPDFYQHTYPHKTQLDEAVAFLHAHQQYISLVTIDLGANDAGRRAPDGTDTSCLLDPTLPGCEGVNDQITGDLAVILDELRTAAGPGVPIVGMTYYNAFAPLWFAAPSFAQQVSDRVDDFNGAIAQSYTDAGDPVADVSGAFHNGMFPLSAFLVCQWTWVCSLGDVHANTTGYGVIAQAFLDALP